MELNFDMSFAIIHPTYRKVMNQYGSMLDLLDSVSTNLEQQYFNDEKSLNEWAETNAREASEGDQMIYESVYGQNCSAVHSHLSDLVDTQNIFYQSMLSTVYAYYESILTLIVKEESLGNVRNPIEAISNTIYLRLLPQIKADFDFLNDSVRHIRNIIAHNYNGTPSSDQITAATNESQQARGFTMHSQDIYEVKKEYVSFVLETEYGVLEAICKELGYHK